MGLLAPLASIFAISLPILLIFYLLKVKRRPRRISSTWLWRETIQDSRASVPFQKLRRNLLMILQLLILALLTAALMRPVLNLIRRESSTALILIDTSASMAMMQPGSSKTRLARARERASRFIDGMDSGSQALVMPYADRALVAVSFTHDKAKLKEAIAKLEVEAAGDDLGEALSLATSLTGTAPNPRIVIFSDTAQLDESLLNQVESIPVVVESCGEEAPNHGWTALDLRPESSTSGLYDLFGQIAAFGGESREVTVKIETEDELLDVRRVRLIPGSEVGVVVEGLELSGEPVIHASIQDDPDRFDALELDNDVWVRVKPSQRLKLIFCTPGNYFLAHILASIEGIDVINVAPDQTLPKGQYDVAIYDRATPMDPPPTPALYIARSPWAEDEASDEEIGAGEITNWDMDHPVSGRVQWSTVTVFGARPIDPPAGTRVLVESGDVPILVLGRAGNQVVLYLAFDLFRSNFPLRIAFPIFIKDAIDWLTQDRASREVQSLGGGEAFTMSVPEDVTRVSVISPHRKGWAIEPGPDRRISFANTYETGLWSVEFDGKVADRFGVNLMNAAESDPVVISSTSIDQSGAVHETGLGVELRTNQEIWKWLALAALAFLLIEWVLYQRAEMA